MKTKLMAFIGLVFLYGCSNGDDEALIQKGFLNLSSKVDYRVRLKGTIPIDGFDVKIVSKTNAAFSYASKAAEVSSKPLALDVGDYTVTVSSPSSEPTPYGAPIYSASSDFSISSGKTTSIDLVCKQANAGVKVSYSEAFLKYCTDRTLTYTTTIEQGGRSVPIDPAVTSAAYFDPGKVTVKVALDGKTYTKELSLAAQDLVSLTIDLTGDGFGSLGLSVTAIDNVNERFEKFVLDSNPPHGYEPMLKLMEDFADVDGSNSSSEGCKGNWYGNTNFTSVDRIYRAGGAVKIGVGNEGGYLQSRVLDLSSNSGNVTVKVKVKGWDKVESPLQITVGEVSKEVPYAALMYCDFEEVQASFPNAGTKQCRVTITSVKSRLFIGEVSVYN